MRNFSPDSGQEGSKKIATYYYYWHPSNELEISVLGTPGSNTPNTLLMAQHPRICELFGSSFGLCTGSLATSRESFGWLSRVVLHNFHKGITASACGEFSRGLGFSKYSTVGMCGTFKAKMGFHGAPFSYRWRCLPLKRLDQLSPTWQKGMRLYEECTEHREGPKS